MTDILNTPEMRERVAEAMGRRLIAYGHPDFVRRIYPEGEYGRRFIIDDMADAALAEIEALLGGTR